MTRAVNKKIQARNKPFSLGIWNFRGCSQADIMSPPPRFSLELIFHLSPSCSLFRPLFHLFRPCFLRDSLQRSFFSFFLWFLFPHKEIRTIARSRMVLTYTVLLRNTRKEIALKAPIALLALPPSWRGLPATVLTRLDRSTRLAWLCAQRTSSARSNSPSIRI